MKTCACVPITTTLQPLAKGFVRRWPKAPPRGTLGEYAVSPRSDLRSPASLPPRPQHAADATRRYTTLFRHSRFAGILPDSVVIQRVEIAESPVKRALRGVCPSSVHALPKFKFCPLACGRNVWYYTNIHPPRHCRGGARPGQPGLSTFKDTIRVNVYFFAVGSFRSGKR